MEINFKTHNGLCPYFTYDNTKFFIQDERQGNDWKYSLCSRNLEKQVYNFKTIEDAKEFLDNMNARLKEIYQSHEYWVDSIHIYKLTNQNNKNIKITVIYDFVQKSGWFDNYLDCLKWSKEYVAKLIKSEEPEQIQMLI